MVELAVSNGADVKAARASMLSILDDTPLCTIATCDQSGNPAAATVFYVLDRDEYLIHALTGPETLHGRNIRANGRAALTVFSSQQEWTDAKRGVQLQTTAGLTRDESLPKVLEMYLRAYPGLGKWVEHASEINSKLESRFFTFQIERCKIFDEPNFGTEVWVEVELRRR